MKKRHMLLINVILAGLMLFSATVVYQFMTGNQPLAIITNLFAPKPPHIAATDACNDKPPIANLGNSKATSLRKLANYQQACHSFVTGTMMTFISMPSTMQQASDYAKNDAKLLKEFASFGVRPLVIAEPSDAAGVQLDFQLFANGTYTPVLARYFTDLKAAGVTEQQLGIWNPFPEANLPYWKNNKPEYFAPAVNAYIGALRAQYTGAQTSILLNSATYDVADFNWENGDYNSLLPYIKGIPKNSITYAGIQGFPWVSRVTGGATILNAVEFLNPALLTEMADYLGTKKVWFNSGTFSTKYALDPGQKKTIPPQQRKEIMHTIEAQASATQARGYDVAINLFAEDKSAASEETDWSYWTDKGPTGSAHAPVFIDFVRDTGQKKIELWLFDK